MPAFVPFIFSHIDRIFTHYFTLLMSVGNTSQLSSSLHFIWFWWNEMNDSSLMIIINMIASCLGTMGLGDSLWHRDFTWVVIFGEFSQAVLRGSGSKMSQKIPSQLASRVNVTVQRGSAGWLLMYWGLLGALSWWHSWCWGWFNQGSCSKVFAVLHSTFCQCT